MTQLLQEFARGKHAHQVLSQDICSAAAQLFGSGFCRIEASTEKRGPYCVRRLFHNQTLLFEGTTREIAAYVMGRAASAQPALSSEDLVEAVDLIIADLTAVQEEIRR